MELTNIYIIGRCRSITGYKFVILSLVRKQSLNEAQVLIFFILFDSADKKLLSQGLKARLNLCTYPVA